MDVWLGKNTPRLETERLILRRFDENDKEAVLQIFGDPEVNVFLPMFPLRTQREAETYLRRQYLEKYVQSVGFYYAVCLKSENIPIGYVNIADENSHDLGYGLRKEFWHKGIMSEATAAVAAAAKRAGISFLTATHDVKNPRSGAVMRNIGMTYQYSYKEFWQPKNIWVTFRMYQMNFDGQESRVYKGYWDKYPEHFIEVWE